MTRRPAASATESVAKGAAPPVAVPVDRSQSGESGYLAALMAPDTPPMIVDVGAHDGLSWSNAAYFIDGGWTALMLEPMPKAFAELQSRYAGNPRVICRQIACADRCGTMDFVIGEDQLAMLSALAPASDPDGAPGPTGGASTGEVSTGGAEAEAGHRIPVRVETLTRVLTAIDWPRDFAILSVDAETMDYEVLLGLDFTRFRPRFIVVEDYEPKRAYVDHMLISEGYRHLTRLGANHIWKHRYVSPWRR